MTKMLDLIAANDLVEVTAYLLGEVTKLAHAGADFGLLASNTPHLVFDDLQRQSPIPLLSIVEADCEATTALGLTKVGLFGTRFTMQGRFYPEVFSRRGITLIMPDADDQSYIHDIYMNELINGLFLVETRERLLAIADRLQERGGVQGVLLGGTELPLLLGDVATDRFRFLDTTKMHVDQAVARMLV